MSNLPEKFIIPKERIPRAFSQHVYKNGMLYTNVNSCATCSVVKVIEVLYSIKNGYYTELSKGYGYVRHSGTSANGTVPDIILKSMVEKKTGTVPYEMCPDYTEKPEICNIILSKPDLVELDREAGNWCIEKWERIQGNNSNDFIMNVKKYIDTYNVPLIGTLKRTNANRVNHSVVIVGYDDTYIYYHDHTGEDTIEKEKYDRWLSHFYYIAISTNGGANKMGQDCKKFKDVKADHWAKKYVDKVVEEGDMKGVSEDEFDIDGNVTRGQLAAVICRLKYGME